jgi:hypothetical protein
MNAIMYFGVHKRWEVSWFAQQLSASLFDHVMHVQYVKVVSFFPVRYVLTHLTYYGCIMIWDTTPYIKRFTLRLFFSFCLEKILPQSSDINSKFQMFCQHCWYIHITSYIKVCCWYNFFLFSKTTLGYDPFFSRFDGREGEDRET